MNERDLEQLRPWLDSEQRPVDVGYSAPYRLVNRGWLRRDFDNFYVLTDRGKDAVEKLTNRPL